MSILSVSEFQDFFPSSSSSEEDIQLAISLATQAMQSPLGANRKLEIVDYQQIKSLRVRESSVLLSYFPIVEVSEVALRGNIVHFFERNTLNLDWFIVPEDFYTLQSNNQLVVQFLLGQTSVSRFKLNAPIDIRVSYSAGFDFDNPSEDVQTIKLLLANCVNFYLTDPRISGTKSFSVDGEYSVSYPSPNVADSSFNPAKSSGSIMGFPAHYLQSFFSYRPYHR